MTAKRNNTAKRKATAKKPVNKGGRPLYQIDYAVLEPLCHMHCTGEECASVLGVDYEALNRALKRDSHGGFREYYKNKSGSGKASLRRLQWKSAKDGNVTMMIWLGKQYLDQTDKAQQDHRSSDGSMVPQVHVYLPDNGRSK